MAGIVGDETKEPKAGTEMKEFLQLSHFPFSGGELWATGLEAAAKRCPFSDRQTVRDKKS